ncbi:Rrf2 family transcriptional regulator [bacterium]|nr:MAG: Rrf2 family transcriptional regulator [bacterium]
MKIITRDTDYAVRALIYMAQTKKKIISTGELIEKLKIPKPFLRKILQTLNKKGVLISYKGPDGGFSLAKPYGKIYLIDLIEIFQGPFMINECVFKKKICPNRSTCSLKSKLDYIEAKVVKELKPVTIKSLLEI